MEQKLVDSIKRLGIKEFADLKSLNVMDGSYLNLACRLPNGKTAKILDDSKKYYASQADIAGTDKCYGVAADESFIAVFRYGCNGADAELVLWKKI